MKPTSKSTLEQLVAMFDVTLLTPSATERDIVDLCTAVSGQGFKRICVNPSYVSRAVQALRGTGVRVVTVIGFPLGATPTECKCFEAERALSDGAAELDMVLNVRLIRETVGPHMGIKASGRVGNLLRAQAMIEAGATRIGLLMAQATAILREWDEAQHINSH